MKTMLTKVYRYKMIHASHINYSQTDKVSFVKVRKKGHSRALDHRELQSLSFPNCGG